MDFENLEVVRLVSLEDVYTKQQRVRLPPKFMRQFPDHYEAEFNFPRVNLISLQIVDPQTPARAKRYGVARQNGSYAVSIPRPWLHDVSARDGDEIELCRSDETPDTLYLRFKRKPR